MLIRNCLALALLCSVPIINASEQPNIVFLFADDLGYGDIGSFNPAVKHTPNIDSLAKSGVKFTSFYSASPVCSPSRAALLTGRYPIRQGIHEVFFPESWTGMPSNEITIAEVLRDKGYYTAMVGKWHLGHRQEFLPLQQGFSEYFGVPYSNDMAGLYYLEGNKASIATIDQTLLTKTFTERAVDIIKRQKSDTPFFLYLAYSMPHVPIFSSEQFHSKTNGAYGDVINELDWSVGRIRETLAAQGLEENTLLIFSSDNGGWTLMGDEGGDNGNLREGKGTTYEGGQRVPTIAYWPKGITQPREYSGIATMMDWLPTFAKLAGADIPDNVILDGQDISPLLLENELSTGRSFAYYSNGDLEAFRQGDWKVKFPYAKTPLKLNWILPGVIPNHGVQLFNLTDDPGEKTNLANELPEKVKELTLLSETFESSLGHLPDRLDNGTEVDRGPYIRMGLKAAGRALIGLVLTIAAIVLLWKTRRRLFGVK
ncbi:MAG: arylsulfatase A [Oceanicoccus sp.]|jgi:arylsulfatase A